MKNLFVAIIFLLTLTITAVNAQIKSQKATVSFLFVSEDVQGSISDLKTDINIDDNMITNSYMKGSVAVTTLKTGNFLRDGHLMWKKYFYKKVFPRIAFESTTISKENEQLKVAGILTIKDISKSVTIIFDKKDDILSGKMRINTYDYGIKISKKKEENIVDVFFDFPLE